MRRGWNVIPEPFNAQQNDPEEKLDALWSKWFPIACRALSLAFILCYVDFRKGTNLPEMLEFIRSTFLDNFVLKPLVLVAAFGWIFILFFLYAKCIQLGKILFFLSWSKGTEIMIMCGFVPFFIAIAIGEAVILFVKLIS
jgi:hypothetical protein